MPAKSKLQKNYMTLVYLYKKGKLDTSKYDKEFIEKIKNTADNMKMKSVKDFVKTKTKDLPEKVKKESLNFDEFLQETKEDKVFNFDEFLNENTTIEIDIEFQNLFNKQYSYTELVLNHLISILCDVNGISEKNFTKVDETINFANNLMNNNEEIDDIIIEFENDNKRYQYCAERIYWKLLVKENIDIKDNE